MDQATERAFERAAEHGVVLLDVSDLDAERFERDLVQRLGHPALVCHGPEDKGMCPLLVGTGCDLVEQAHGIVFQLDLDRPQHRAILKRYKKVVDPSVPIAVVCAPEQAIAYAELLEGLEVWTHEPTAGDLDRFAAEVEAADLAREE